jgi:hypothetical protein
VVAGGSWPRLLPANSPVFRTPVTAPGAQAVNETLPGTPVPSGTAGYGWVPLGVAHPPYFLAEKGSGLSGYGSESPLDLSAEDQAWLKANPGKVQKAIRDSAIAYASLRAQQNTYHALYKALAKEDAVGRANVTQAGGNAYQRATQIVYGGEAAKVEASRMLQRMAAVATEVQLVAEKEGMTLSGPLSVLASQPDESPSNLTKGRDSLSLNGFGIAVSTIVVISIIATAAVVGTGTYLVTASFNETAEIAAKSQAEYLRSTRAAREAASESLARLYKKLEGADATDAARIQDAINTITNSLAVTEKHNTDLAKKAGVGNWSQYLLIGGAGVFLWWILGKPFWKGARRSAESAWATSGLPGQFEPR